MSVPHIAMDGFQVVDILRYYTDTSTFDYYEYLIVLFIVYVVCIHNVMTENLLELPYVR